MEALAALKAKLQEADPKSEERGSFPLTAYLTIYQKARRECYVDYMEGARLLKEWIGPLAFRTVSSITVPHMLRNYELYELAKIIRPTSYQEGEDSIYAFLIGAMQ